MGSINSHNIRWTPFLQINCVLSDKPSLLNDNLSLTEVGDWLIKVGVTAYRAVIDYMNITLMEMRGQVDSSQTRSHIEKLQTALVSLQVLQSEYHPRARRQS